MNFEQSDYSLIIKFILEKGLVKISDEPVYKLKEMYQEDIVNYGNEDNTTNN